MNFMRKFLAFFKFFFFSFLESINNFESSRRIISFFRMNFEIFVAVFFSVFVFILFFFFLWQVAEVINLSFATKLELKALNVLVEDVNEKLKYLKGIYWDDCVFNLFRGIIWWFDPAYVEMVTYVQDLEFFEKVDVEAAMTYSDFNLYQEELLKHQERLQYYIDHRKPLSSELWMAWMRCFSMLSPFVF